MRKQNEYSGIEAIAGLLFFAWIFVAACGLLGWWLVLTPLVVVSLWLARVFEPRTQAWMDLLARRAYSKFFNK